MNPLRPTLFFVVTLALVGGCVNRPAQEKAKETAAIVTDKSIPVTTDLARTVTQPVTLALTGSIEASDEVAVSSKLGGKIVAVYVREGSSVSIGQVVARLDSSDADARVRQARQAVAAAQAQYNQARMDASVTSTKSDAAVKASEARVRQAEANLQKLVNGAREEEKRQAKANLEWTKADLAKAKTDLDRAQRLYAQQAIAKVEVEAAQNRHDLANANYQRALEQYNLALEASRPEDIAAAREAVSQAKEQLRLDQANKKLDPVADERVRGALANLNSSKEGLNLALISQADLSVRSLVSGKVTGKPLREGSVVAPGTPICVVVGGATPVFVAEVPETDISELKPGTHVDVLISALGDVRLRGTVASIDPKASELGRLYSVRILVQERMDSVKPGMFATGLAVLGSVNGVSVDNRSLLQDGEDYSLFTTDGKTAKKVSVKVVHAGNERTVVTGVEDGDKIVVAGQTLLIDGSDVVDAKEKPAGEVKKGA